jgi:hypothetical protein
MSSTGTANAAACVKLACKDERQPLLWEQHGPSLVQQPSHICCAQTARHSSSMAIFVLHMHKVFSAACLLENPSDCPHQMLVPCECCWAQRNGYLLQARPGLLQHVCILYVACMM